MRKFDWRIAVGVGVIGVLCLLWLLLTGGLIWAALEEAERAAVVTAVGPRALLLIMMWAVSLGVVAVVLQRLIGYFMTAPARLAEEAQVLLGTDVKRQLKPKGSPENQRLTEVINQLVGQREQLRTEMTERVKEASRNTELEKSRLAALMSELTKSVVVCNLDGRILLYNHRARSQFRALSKSPTVAGGLELIGLGRSIYSVLDRKLVTHALENIQHRLQGGAPHPSAQFVTTTQSGQLLRVQMTPVRAVPENIIEPSKPESITEAEAEPGAEVQSGDAQAQSELTGFVLLLENITHDFEADSEKDRVLFGLTEGSRAGLANAQAAVEVLEYPDLETDMRERLLGVIREEIQGLGKRIDELQASSTHNLRSRWPLEDMLGSDLVEAASRRIEAALPLQMVSAEMDTALWLKVESFSLLQALVHLAGRVHEVSGVGEMCLRLGEVDTRATLDLVWSAASMDTQDLLNWDQEQIRVGDETLSLTVHDVVSRHDGAFWFEREESGSRMFFRFLLPMANPQEALAADTFQHSGSRPEYYDFDLFKTSAQGSAFEDCLLSELAYTVFDTETTGLDPAGGDEIIQVGAVRIVNGKLLRQETFEQLVDPKRHIPAITIPIHGITPDMVKGQPDITQVLPALHAFAQDTVLVAHNAAFDMRCLQVKEEATGVVFDQPVMDTLLLSAVIHPQQESHGLEAIAERFNVNVIGRHTALGDALVTAEVFLKLLPLLAEQGILTVGQAREAAQKTYYARLKY
ncbi:exonuclease domain-containing protein [Neptunomonas sp.]|uniref:3'-5' exonuclease n=1 Tax=Neptunomonas sp. TaxID=1971898 RepID=UPI0035664846